MKISIIIPVYQVEEYVGRCLRSVMEQRYEEIECILVDDCGTDRSIDICESLIGEYIGSIRFRILHHEHNRGPSAARNTGTAAATGEYIFYLDSDDELSPDCIALMAEEVQKRPGVEMVTAWWTWRQTTDGASTDKILCRERLCLEGKEQVRSVLYARYWGIYHTNAWNKLINADFLRRTKLQFIEGILFEDLVYTFYLTQHCKSVSILPNITYTYNALRQRSIVNSLDWFGNAKWNINGVGLMLKGVQQPVGVLQTYRCLIYVLVSYRRTRRRDYSRLTARAAWNLAKNGRIVEAGIIYFYFRFKSLLRLYRYEKRFSKWFFSRYDKEAARAQKSCGIRLKEELDLPDTFM